MVSFAIPIHGSVALIAWISSSNITFTSLIAIFTVVQIVSALLSLFFLREVTSDIKEVITQENMAENEINQAGSSNYAEAGEQIALTSRNENTGASYYGDKQGFSIMNVVDFWLLSFSFIVSIAIDKTFFMNIGTYLRSFNQEQYLTLLSVTGPLVALATKIIFGPISDACVHMISRIWFFTVPTMVKIVALFLFLFLGDNIGIMIFTSYSCYLTMGSMFLLGPILAGEYFGLKYYGRNFGTMLFACGIFTVFLHVILGVVYDLNVSGVKDALTCVGLKCFQASTIILIVLTISTLCTSLALWKRTPKFLVV